MAGSGTVSFNAVPYWKVTLLMLLTSMPAPASVKITSLEIRGTPASPPLVRGLSPSVDAVPTPPGFGRRNSVRLEKDPWAKDVESVLLMP